MKTHIEVTQLSGSGSEGYKTLVPLANLVLEKTSDTITMLYAGINEIGESRGIAIKETYEEVKALILGAGTESVLANLPNRDFTTQPITENDICLEVYSAEFGRGRVVYYDNSAYNSDYPIGVSFINVVSIIRSFTPTGLYIKNSISPSNIQPWVN